MSTIHTETTGVKIADNTLPNFSGEWVQIAKFPKLIGIPIESSSYKDIVLRNKSS